jgi:hypothetical protein
MRVFVDLTEFCTSPLRTGIQRVAGELCRLWPPEHELVPVKLVRGRGLVILPEKTLGLIQRYFESSPDEASELLASLRRVGKQADFLGATVPMERGTCVLVPEVFYDPERLNFFKSFGPTMPGESFLLIAFFQLAL